MPKGDLVMVKTFLNQPIMRRMLREDDRTVIVCRDEFFSAVQGENSELQGTAILRDKVFKRDENLFNEMLELDEQMGRALPQLMKLWEQAVPY